MSSRDSKRADLRFWVAILCWCAGNLLMTLFALWVVTHDDPFTRRDVMVAAAGVLGIVGVLFGFSEVWHRLHHGPQQPGRRIYDENEPVRLGRRPMRR